MWPLVALGGALWWLSRPQRNPELADRGWLATFGQTPTRRRRGKASPTRIYPEVEERARVQRAGQIETALQDSRHDPVKYQAALRDVETFLGELQHNVKTAAGVAAHHEANQVWNKYFERFYRFFARWDLTNDRKTWMEVLDRLPYSYRDRDFLPETAKDSRQQSDRQGWSRSQW